MFKKCELCGASLDAGEKCDCEKERNAALTEVESDKSIKITLSIPHTLNNSKEDTE